MMSGENKPKRLLLIDAVDWSDEYPAKHPLRNVSNWFKQHFRDLPEITINVLHSQDHGILDACQTVQGVVLSGSPRDAWTDNSVNDKLIEIIGYCRDLNIPFLGVCYGHQLLGRFLGAKVGRDPNGLELGTTEVELTEAGQSCLLFSGLSKKFSVLQSHQDALLTFPDAAKLLATGTQTRVQALRYGDKMMGIQFHPEMNPDILRFLWAPRRAIWRQKVDFDLDRCLDTMTPTPVGPRILMNFVQHFVG